MKRYTQGLKYFGPMEQCKDGEWVKYDEAHGELYRRERSLAAAEQKWRWLEQENKDLRSIVKGLIVLYAAAAVGLYISEYLL